MTFLSSYQIGSFASLLSGLVGKIDLTESITVNEDSTVQSTKVHTKTKAKRLIFKRIVS